MVCLRDLLKKKEGTSARTVESTQIQRRKIVEISRYIETIINLMGNSTFFGVNY